MCFYFTWTEIKTVKMQSYKAWQVSLSKRKRSCWKCCVIHDLRIHVWFKGWPTIWSLWKGWDIFHTSIFPPPLFLFLFLYSESRIMSSVSSCRLKLFLKTYLNDLHLCGAFYPIIAWSIHSCIVLALFKCNERVYCCPLVPYVHAIDTHGDRRERP